MPSNVCNLIRMPGARLPAGWIVAALSCAAAIRVVALPPPEPPQTLIPAGSRWIYYDGEIGQGTAWRQLSFDDSGWWAGPAPMGYGEGNEATVLDPDENRPVTLYFRRKLEIPSTPKISTMTLRLRRDDGVVVHVNGVEVMRNNMPDGPASFQTYAATPVEGTLESNWVQWGLWPGYFTTGTNQIAVEIHQAYLSWHDAAFDLELMANIPLTPPVVSILWPPDGAYLPLGGIPIETSVFDADGHLFRMLFYSGTNEIGQVEQEPYSFFWPGAGPGRYVLKAMAIDHSGRRSFSPPVHIQVGSVAGSRLVRGPYLQSGSPTSMTICWRTDWFQGGQVRYGTQPDRLDQKVEDERSAVDHQITLENLQPGTRYYYSVGTLSETLSSGLDHSFVTSPTNTQPVRVWVLGDSGTADFAARAVRDAYLDFNYSGRTDLWLMLGDNAYEEGTDEEYQKAVFDMYPEMLRQSVLWPTIGNHELGLGNYESFAYLDVFHLPKSGESGGLASGTERYYSFDFSNLHFVCLDSQTSDRFPGGAMQAWLEADLAATDRDWIIAYWHHPPYSKGTHNSDSESQLIEMREQFLPILERNGVDLVLAGHSHVYERSFLLNGHYGYSSNLAAGMIVDGRTGRAYDNEAYQKPAGGLGSRQGAVYVVCGNSGQTGGFRDGPHPVMFFSHAGMGSLILDADGLRLDATYLTSEGFTHDSFTIIKGWPSPGVRPELSIGPGPGPSQITLSWPTSLGSWTPVATDPASPDGPWLPIPAEPAQAGRRHVLRLDAHDAARWFRLRSDE